MWMWDLQPPALCNKTAKIFYNLIAPSVVPCCNFGDAHLVKTVSIANEMFLCLLVSSAPQVTPDVHFQKDLGLDSLDNVEIVMALEEEFKLEIPDKEADKIDSCNLAIEYIANHPMAG